MLHEKQKGKQVPFPVMEDGEKKKKISLHLYIDKRGRFPIFQVSSYAKKKRPGLERCAVSKSGLWLTRLKSSMEVQRARCDGTSSALLAVCIKPGLLAYCQHLLSFLKQSCPPWPPKQKACQLPTSQSVQLTLEMGIAFPLSPPKKGTLNWQLKTTSPRHSRVPNFSSLHIASYQTVVWNKTLVSGPADLEFQCQEQFCKISWWHRARRLLLWRAPLLKGMKS